MSKAIEETKPGEKGFCSVCDNQYSNYQAFSTFICIDCYRKGYRVKIENRMRKIIQQKKETDSTKNDDKESPCKFRARIAKKTYRCNLESRYVVYCAYTDHASKEIKECWEIHKKQFRSEK
jgi:hypothetical protein